MNSPASIALALCLSWACTSNDQAPASDPPVTERAPPDRPGQTRPVIDAHTALDAHAGPDEDRSRARDVRVTILSTMLADDGIGEWGFSALIEVDGRALLFDTGKFPDTVVRNARALDIDLSRVQQVVLSHHHDDHIGGLKTLRSTLREHDARAIGRVHVAAGMFRERRRGPDGRQLNQMLAVRRDMTADGVEFVVHNRPTELLPGVWLTGPVPRIHDERNYTTSRKVRSGARWQADILPESQALVIDTRHGLVVIAGCGHAGLINTLDHARAAVRDAPIHAALGGFHLLRADDDHLRWTGQALTRVGIEHFMGAHCTGIEAVFRLREYAGLKRATAVVGAVGARFVAGRGLEPGALAR